MKTQWEIEHEWDVAKILVTNMDFKLLLYILPQYGLYIQSLAPIPVTYEDRTQEFQIRFEDAKLPYIVTVRTEDTSRVADFIQEHKEFRAYRIFKHGMYYDDLEKSSVIGLICDVTKNMLHLFPGKTFHIDSKDRKLRDLFYEKAVEINKEDDLGCSFDYDEYDYTLNIRKYKRFKDGEFYRWAVITILYGEDLPNSWSMRDEGEGSDMSEDAGCPNSCGVPILLKRRIPILHLIPTELLDHLQGKETPEGMYGYLIGTCPVCGFILATRGEDEE